jgi:hypothetical protein
MITRYMLLTSMMLQIYSYTYRFLLNNKWAIQILILMLGNQYLR